MKTLFKISGITVLFLSMTTLYAEGGKATVAESIKKCISLVQSECKSSDFRGCSEKSKKKAKVLQCQDYLLQHAKGIEKQDMASLGKEIQKDIQAVGEVNEDQQKCVDVYQKVCGDLSMGECVKAKANQFPSFCREVTPSDPQQVLKQAGIRQEIASECAQNIQKSCKLEIPKHQEGKDNMKAYRAATEKYQKCLQESVKKSNSCKSVVAKDKSSKAIQLIE